MIDAKIVPDFIRNPPDQVCRVSTNVSDDLTKSSLYSKNL